MLYESERVIRGVHVIVKAGDFDSDPDVGIAYGPTCISAETEDGQEFELTPAEEAEISVAATEWAEDSHRDFDDDYM